jgi:serine/threonine-protein kinase
MLQELVSGTAPFRAETLSALLAAVVADAPIPLRAVMPTAPPGLEELILRCLQKNPDHRFENVAAFAAALAPYASPGGQRAVERVSSLLSGGVVSARAAGPALAPTLDPYAAVQSAMTPIPSPVPSPPASGGGLSPAPHFAQPLPVAAYSQDGLAASRGGRPALPPSNAGMFVGIGSAAVVVILVVIGVAYVGIQAHKRSIAANDPTASTTQPAAPPPPAPSATTTPASMLAPITSTPLPSATTHPSAHPTSTTTATATGGGGSTFDESGARAMLRSAATGAANCGDSDGPSGSGVARVTFSTSGNVANVYVSPPFSGTAVGACVSRKLVGVVVDPFTGPPHAVNVQFNVP